jgi:hypothetical protein
MGRRRVSYTSMKRKGKFVSVDPPPPKPHILLYCMAVVLTLIITEHLSPHAPFRTPSPPRCSETPFPNCSSNYSQPVSNRLSVFFSRVLSSTLKIEAARSSETSVYNKPTRQQIPENDILHCPCVILSSHN